MFEKISPEEAGVSSERVLSFLKMLDFYRFRTHSVMMLKGDSVFAEVYYKPFNENFLHRMYSVSKSFVSIAIGLAVTEGLVSLDDIIIDYLPEFKNENCDFFHDRCTIGDMLKMKSNIGGNVNWWGNFKSRIDAYYTLKTSKVPSTIYFYDSIGSFLLGCIIEKLTGKHFLEYLKEKVLIPIGFSKESFTLLEPGGFSVGDSAVMCTARDLSIFARFIMKKGRWEGKQYIDKSFMEEAISKQSTNSIFSGFNSYDARGYGYLIWKTHESGFSLMGLGDQLAICDTEKDFCFVMTADNQHSNASRHIIFHELLNSFIPSIKDKPLPENPAALKQLEEYISSRELLCQQGDADKEISEKINGKTFQAMENNLKIENFTLNLSEDSGSLIFVMNGKNQKINFGILKNKFENFSFGSRTAYGKMGEYVEGEYSCANSGAWADDNTFTICIQVIDQYFGCMQISISFKDNFATLFFARSGQYVFEGIEGYVIGKIKEEI